MTKKKSSFLSGSCYFIL